MIFLAISGAILWALVALFFLALLLAFASAALDNRAQKKQFKAWLKEVQGKEYKELDLDDLEGE